MESHHDKLLHISSNHCLPDRFTDSADSDAASQGTALGRAALHLSNESHLHPHLERMQLHRLYHLCLVNYSVFDNSYGNSILGQRWTRIGFLSHGTLPIPDHNSSSSGKLQAVRLSWKASWTDIPELNLTAAANIYPTGTCTI